MRDGQRGNERACDSSHSTLPKKPHFLPSHQQPTKSSRRSLDSKKRTKGKAASAQPAPGTTGATKEQVCQRTLYPRQPQQWSKRLVGPLPQLMALPAVEQL
ncbi:hypothetical protein RvY_17529 [Ramazzottius varieornatus]|uniref:Uncharacterized protein n=1 Tax=Ramazzottius varieornatus TaxID=947166 RepID=A0A1D1W2F2_RAMVA|nr:hypothetical protein RvY_17529 [Ramazzottius varieornatus]